MPLLLGGHFCEGSLDHCVCARARVSWHMVEGRPVSNKATLFSPLQCSTPAMLAVRIGLRARSDRGVRLRPLVRGHTSLGDGRGVTRQAVAGASTPPPALSQTQADSAASILNQQQQQPRPPAIPFRIPAQGNCEPDGKQADSIYAAKQMWHTASADMEWGSGVDCAPVSRWQQAARPHSAPTLW